ncbi:pitrilysin family protein [Desulfuromonas sp. TF]|uniref:M16 family metallopeptidase n=1 Tax=Desulfuromonas sp. TF TaxID=1232410 RepID=UPI000415D369|nr:pitrilysin family protein [Desulfuromonas sp. TF]
MRRKIPVIPCILFVIVLFLSSCAPRPQAFRPDQLEFDPLVFHVPQVDRIDLPNGIRLYLKEDHELPLVQVTAMVGAGSIGEPAEKTGLGSLFAAALRTGGAGGYSPDELDRILERQAANLSVATGTYATTIDLSVQASDLPLGLAVVADLLRRPGFAPERMELARKQIIEDIRRQNDLPSSIASRTLSRAVYGDHPLGRTPTVESVSSITRGELTDFHQRYFHPNNVWFAVSGDFDRKALLDLLDRQFGGWPRVEFAPQAIPPVQKSREPKVLAGDKTVPQTTILIGELGIDKSDPDLHSVRVMNYILGGGGFNSRLMREIRSNRGLAYSVYSYYQVGRRLPGPFIAGAETKSSSTLDVVETMRRIMAEMREEPVTDAELELARESLINSFVFAFTDTHDVVTQIMRLDFYEYPEGYLESFRDRVAAVSKEDVLRVAREHLNPESQKIVLVGDRAAFDNSLEALGIPVEAVSVEE